MSKKRTRKYILGIDPGVSGGIAVYNQTKRMFEKPIAVKKLTPREVFDELEKIHADAQICYIERVHSMPKQGVRTTFTFGQNFGTYIGFLTALKIPIVFVAPGIWQRTLGCLSKRNKNVTKQKAQELFPYLRLTHQTADAVLIAEYGRRRERGPEPAAPEIKKNVPQPATVKPTSFAVDEAADL